MDKAITADTNERVEELVADILGDEFKVYHFCPSGFDVRLTREGKEVFGCGFSVRVDDNWHYNDDKVFVREPRVEVSIGTCGSFPIGVGDDQEKKYMAFARFMSMLQEVRLDKVLIKCNEEIRSHQRAHEKMREQYVKENS